MIKRLFCAAALVAIPQFAFAEACNETTLAEFRTINDMVADQERSLRKLKARADSQDFRLIDLSEDLQQTVPARPEAPELLVAEIDGAAFDCDPEGEAVDFLIEQEAALGRTQSALDAFDAALVTREEALTAAEDLAANPPADPAEEEPKVAEGPVIEGETPQEEAPPETEQENIEPPLEEEGEIPDEEAEQEEGEVKTAEAREPMPDTENPALYRRVISLPDARLASEPAAAEDGISLPVFSVLYVYDQSAIGGEDWIEVGDTIRDGPAGWIKVDAALPWSSMLVMQFTPRGQRERVLFFRDATPLSDIVNSPFYANEARDIYAEVESERERLKGAPGDSPNWNSDLVAIEPETAVTYANEPYLLPILDWREELFDGLVETTLLQVAAIPAEAEEVGERDTQSFENDAGEQAALDDEFRIGLVFVMDTTVSMAPFIDRTREVINEFYNEFGRLETSQYISFGLVGFRDSTDHNNELDYVTQVFQPLDPEAPARQILSNMERIQEADEPTIEFKEDAYAGLTEAIDGMDWTPFDARLIILVTDASARSGNDELMQIPGLTAETVAADARASNIAIVPVHLLTPVNEENNDVAVAANQFRTLSDTGDINFDKYLSIDATDDAAFAEQISRLAEGIARAVLQANSGNEVAQVELEPVPNVVPGEPEENRLSKIVTNEIFRAQLESLAQVGGGDAPAFLAGWASDRDMLDPNLATLEVSVFLTRTQLSTLDKRLDAIVDAFRSGGDDPQAFFDKLQVLAAEMSTDPDAVRADDRLAVQTLLPTFLQNLPYKSEVLLLDRDYWSSLSNADREGFIETIEAKQRIYLNTFDQTNVWNDFGSDDPGLEATLMLLKHLP